MRGRLSYSCCFVGCGIQELFKTAHSILDQFPCSFILYTFSLRPCSAPFSRMDTATVCKKSRFISSDRLYFHRIDNLSISYHTISMLMLTSLSGDEILLPKYVNVSTNFSSLPQSDEMALFCLKHLHSRWGQYLLQPALSYATEILLESVYLLEVPGHLRNLRLLEFCEVSSASYLFQREFSFIISINIRST